MTTRLRELERNDGKYHRSHVGTLASEYMHSRRVRA